MDIVENVCFNVDGIGDVYVDVKSLPLRKFLSLQSNNIPDDVKIINLIDVLQKSVKRKDNNEIAFTDEYMDNLTMGDFEDLTTKFTDSVSKSTENSKKN